MNPQDPPDRPEPSNELWQRHHDDEVRAIADQQQRAGRSHQPVEGPPPYGSEQVNLMAREIIEREREDCARLVEAWPAGGDSQVSQLLGRIAEAIRGRA